MRESRGWRGPSLEKAARAVGLLLLAASAWRCGPTPQEPDAVPSFTEHRVAANVEGRVLGSMDGIAPDTVAFLARITNWNGESELFYQVESDVSLLDAGRVPADQVQIAFEFNPELDVHLSFSAWTAGTDTARVKWSHTAD